MISNGNSFNGGSHYNLGATAHPSMPWWFRWHAAGGRVFNR